MYTFLADVLTGAHLAYVLVVVLGLLLTLLGKAMGWKWASNRWFRSIHLAMIVGVVIRATVWKECPLTWWERDLRNLAEGAGQARYSAVGQILHSVLHPSAVPMWVYLPLYSAFGLLVVATLWLVPVRWRKQPQAAEGVGELTLAPGDETT
jgi:hypothetical protein